MWGHRAPGQGRGSGYRKLSKIKQGRGNCLWRVINLLHLDEINRNTGIEGHNLCKIVGLILFESAHLILAKRLREQTVELSRLLLASTGFWKVIGWWQSRIMDSELCRGCQPAFNGYRCSGPWLQFPALDAASRSAEGTSIFMKYQVLSTFFNFSISAASLFSLRTDCFKPVCLQRQNAWKLSFLFSSTFQGKNLVFRQTRHLITSNSEDQNTEMIL